MNRRTILMAGASLLVSPQGFAAGQSWQADLVAGGGSGAERQAGLRIKLQPGWKTYWKMPGDAGIPPEFDWSRSENVASVDVLYPAPARFRDASGETVGYHDEVVFPLRVVLKDASRPARLALNLMFAVCRNVCIPATTQLEAEVGTASSSTALQQWQSKVPEQLPQGKGPILEHHLVSQNGKLALTLKLAIEPQDIFIFSDTSAYFGAPQPSPTPGEWLLAISNIKDIAKLKGKRLDITVVGQGKAVEQSIVLN